MKKIILLAATALLLSGCVATKNTETKLIAFKDMYEQKPLSVLIMPPINKSTNVEAKEYFHSTLNVPLANAGYYVIPPFLSMEILKKESAYDSELFIDRPLELFGKVFGADMALFTIIHKWDKSKLLAKVYVEVEYIVKSISTNEILYSRKGDVTYDATINVEEGGVWGALIGMAASAINTAATRYVDVARTCNAFTFKNIPAGKYSPLYEKDTNESAGQKVFSVTLNSKYQ